MILYSSDNYDKLDQIVIDRSKFTETKTDPEKPHPVIQKQNSVNYYVDKYLKGHIDDEISSDISPSGANLVSYTAIVKFIKQASTSNFHD